MSRECVKLVELEYTLHSYLVPLLPRCNYFLHGQSESHLLLLTSQSVHSHPGHFRSHCVAIPFLNEISVGYPPLLIISFHFYPILSTFIVFLTFGRKAMAHTVLRIPGFFSQLCMLNNGSTQMRSRGLHPFSPWNLNNPHRQVLVPDLKAKHWEIGSSNTASKDTFETNVDCGSFTPMSEARAEYDQTMLEQDNNGIDVMGNNPKQNDTLMFSIAPLPYFILAALPGAETIRSVFGPFAELVKTWNLPDWLVHWGHPANMAVVLFAMGGYGSYLGWQIRLSDDVEVKAKAKDLHPKLLGGMFFFFALGATGGITSLLTSDKPILESPHAVTGFIGLGLLTLQTALPALFEGNPGLRNVHGVLGSGIMALFLIHSVLGLQLGLSF